MNSRTVAHNQAKRTVTEASGEKVQDDAEDRETTMAIEPRKAEASAVPCNVFRQYQLHGLIDKGTFSTVSLATLRNEQHLPPDAKRRYAIKHITPTSHPVRIEREIMCMLKIGGQCNVVGLVEFIRHRGSVALVMDYIPQEPFDLYYGRFTPAEVQRYIQQLLIALERVHLYGVIHRDVKPSNFLHCPAKGTYVLVDFGLAQETDKGVLSLRDDNTRCRPDGGKEQPKSATMPVRYPAKRKVDATKSDSAEKVAGGGQKYQRVARQPVSQPTCNCYGRAQVCNWCLVRPEMNAPRAGTPGYRPPEVLLKYPHQTTAVDIWAAGVILFSLLSKRYPIFENADDGKSLAHLIQVFGFERLRDTARLLDVNLGGDPKTMAIRPYCLRRVCQYLRREAAGGGGGAAVADAAGGSSPPSGRDDEQQPFVCDNCCQPVYNCLCLRPSEGVGGGLVANGDSQPDADDRDCDEYGPAAYELLERLLETNPHRRITATDALKHPYFQVQY